MAVTTTAPIPKCQKCRHVLTDIVEEWSGSDHWEFDEKKIWFETDIHGRTEDTSKLSCFHCGAELTIEQKEWFNNHH